MADAQLIPGTVGFMASANGAIYDSNQISIYKSASDFIKENKLSKKSVTVNLRKNRLRSHDGWWYL
jgi:hypothetical protein